MIEIPYYCLRRVTDPAQSELGIEHYEGKCLVSDVIGIPVDGNLRDYIPDAGKRTKVHRDIADTLINDADHFSVLNAGLTIVAEELQVLEKAKKIILLGKRVPCGIVNGSQTKGVATEILEQGIDMGAYISIEVIITKDDALARDIAIARNNQNKVQQISFVNKRGSIDDLVRVCAKYGMNLRRTETDIGTEFINTERLIQIVRLLTPDLLWDGKWDNDGNNGRVPVKAHIYSSKSTSVQAFEDICTAAKDPEHENHSLAKEVYQAYLDLAPQAWQLYQYWKAHPNFMSSRIRKIEKDKSRKVVLDVPDGIIFPILSAYSQLVKKNGRGWEMCPVPKSAEDSLYKRAVRQYTGNARSRPHTMGRAQTIYTDLYCALADVRPYLNAPLAQRN
jgi:hypothetical protein